ncbi:acyl-CoA dehydrogenase family protein [Novosphingobium lentum]|uniref:acyl-CoA dehydrogenase family protein n=1 Tax=Novosphingobium lentum TaxID=145287 RepID=UPI000AA9D6D1|nr:acyl-CoA dehydrogenase family protein [Novosphingobium lentum]
MATVAKLNVDAARGFASKDIADGFVELARSLRPLLQSEAAAGEKLRAPTPAVDKALKEHGLLQLLLPKRLGGHGLSTTDFCRVQIEIAKGDPAVSWVMQIINGTSWITSLASDGVQDAVFGDGPQPVCGAYNPPGKARKVDGGWIINGKWPYMSGSRQSTWAQQGVVLEDYDGPVVPGINMCYLPMASMTIVDSWFVSGMQGTGSDTAIAENVFIPDTQMMLMDERAGQIDTTKRHFGDPSDMLPAVPVVRTTGIAQLIGAVEAMVEIVTAESAKKPVLTTFITSRNNSGAYMRDLGEAAAMVNTAKLILFDLTAKLDRVALGEEFTLAEKAMHRSAGAQMIELVHGASESLMFQAGSSAFSLDKPINRYWRDVSMATRHIQNIPTIGYEIYGRNLAGADGISPPGAY